jgi:predicted transcriptional regulator
MTDTGSRPEILELTSKIVSAHVSNNMVAMPELPHLISDVHQALASLGEETAEGPEPAVPINKSVTPSHIVCLEDGRKFKVLKRHLRVSFGMTPEEYREKWGLPADYPMVAPKYAKVRSKLAKQFGLGAKPGERRKPRRRAVG